MPRRRLVLEGLRDLSFVIELGSQHGFEVSRPDIAQCEGIDNAFADFELAIKSKSYDRIGLVVDADADAKAAWARAVGRMRNAGLRQRFGASIRTEGARIETDGVPSRIGVWIMPDNASAGDMERLASFMIPRGDALWDRARDAVAGLPNPRRFRAKDSTKAEVHTWLAWQLEPGLGVGAAVRSKYLDPACNEAAAFVDWLRWLWA